MGLRDEARHVPIARTGALKRLSTRVNGLVQKLGKKSASSESTSKRLSDISDIEDSKEKLTESNALNEHGLRIIKCVAAQLQKRVQGEDRVNENDPFSKGRVPPVGLDVYIARLARYVNIWRGHAGGRESAGVRSAVLAMMYLDRLEESTQGEYVLNEQNIHRLVMVGFLVATKFEEDRPIGNDFWSKVGGVPMVEVNRLESAFCNLLSFRFFVETEEYENALDFVDMPEF